MSPDDEANELVRAYYGAQSAAPGQRYATFQNLAPPPAPEPSPQQLVQAHYGQQAPPPGSAGAALAKQFYGAPAPGMIPEVTVTPRRGLPGTLPGQARPVARPPVASKAILNSAIRQAALGGAQTEDEAFESEFAAQMGEERPQFQRASEGTLTPHKVGLTVKPMLPGEEQQLQEAEDEGFAAQREQGEAQIQSAEQVADQLVKQAEQQEQIDARFAEREMERQGMLRDREARFAEMADNVANMDTTAPSLWGDGTGEQLINRLSVFLGSVGAGAQAAGGMQNPANLAYEKLAKDLENNIAAQKESRALKVGRLKDEQTLIEMARERFKSEGAVDAVVRESAYRKLGAELERFKEFAKTPERRAALEALTAQNNAQLSELARQRRMAMDADVLNERAIKARAAAAGGGDPRKQLLGKLKTEVGIKEATDTLQGKSKTPEDAKAIRKAEADYEATMKSIARYEQSNVDVGITSAKAAKEKAEQEQQSAARTYQKEFLGASENDAKAADQAFPSGGTFTSKASVQAAAQAARQRAKDKRDAAVKAAGGSVTSFTPQGAK